MLQRDGQRGHVKAGIGAAEAPFGSPAAAERAQAAGAGRLADVPRRAAEEVPSQQALSAGKSPTSE